MQGSPSHWYQCHRTQLSQGSMKIPVHGSIYQSKDRQYTQVMAGKDTKPQPQGLQKLRNPKPLHKEIPRGTKNGFWTWGETFNRQRSSKLTSQGLRTKEHTYDAKRERPSSRKWNQGANVQKDNHADRRGMPDHWPYHVRTWGHHKSNQTEEGTGFR